jgi:hypothetical protein
VVHCATTIRRWRGTTRAGRQGPPGNLSARPAAEIKNRRRQRRHLCELGLVYLWRIGITVQAEPPSWAGVFGLRLPEDQSGLPVLTPGSGGGRCAPPPHRSGERPRLIRTTRACPYLLRIKSVGPIMWLFLTSIISNIFSW